MVYNLYLLNMSAMHILGSQSCIDISSRIRSMGKSTQPSQNEDSMLVGHPKVHRAYIFVCDSACKFWHADTNWYID